MRTASPSVELAAKILSAYVTRNNVPADVLPELLLQVHRSIATLGRPSTTSIDRPTDAQIRASIRPDSLISFEDGKPYKALRRHLTIRGLTPDRNRPAAADQTGGRVAPRHTASDRRGTSRPLRSWRLGGRRRDVLNQ